ncbi:MAG: DNA replication/repair protein RecF [Gammaproteobacteria bacterium]|nr:DNA replication/repair protein RecF [Gammaproteobacteria bacterium]
MASMALARLHIQNIRNIAEARIELAPSLNVICGLNASGKTSLLEAIYLLGRAKSFRSSQLQKVITRGASGLTVFGQIAGEKEQCIPVGIAWSADKMRMKVAGQPVTRTSDLASHLPLLLITPDSHKILSLGPRLRRRFMDWGVFHVEHDFMTAWSRYCRALRQRNASLRLPARQMPENVWDKTLAETAQQIDQFRRNYLRDFLPLFAGFVEKLLQRNDISLRYLPGWAQEEDYHASLIRSLERDRSLGHTSRGPHRADVIVEADGRPAHEHTSGGQQKLLMCAMYLAQAALLKNRTSRQCLILIDDLPAELDVRHRARLMELLCESGAQIIITATDRALIEIPHAVEHGMFHVEQGVIIEQRQYL